MYYIWGSQDSGKDTKVKMLHAFLGYGKDNYGVQLPGNYVVQQTRYLTGPAPYHARTLGKRLAWASEVPEHYSLADEQSCAQHRIARPALGPHQGCAGNGARGAHTVRAVHVVAQQLVAAHVALRGEPVQRGRAREGQRVRQQVRY